MGGERGSGRSVLAVQHDDDEVSHCQSSGKSVSTNFCANTGSPEGWQHEMSQEFFPAFIVIL